MPRMFTGTRRNVKSVEIQITLKVSGVQPRSFNANLVISMDTLQGSVIRRNMLHSGQGNQRLIFYKWALFMLVINPCAATSFCLQVKIQQSQAEGKKISTPSHLIANLYYKLIPHQTRTQYLRARLDSCTDVNIMPTSVYKWCLMTLN